MTSAARPNQHGEWYGLPDTPKLTTRQLGSGVVDIVRVRYEGSDHEFAAYPQFERALLVHVQLRPMRAAVGIDGAACRPLVTPAGGVNILDLRSELGGRMVTAFDEIIFHLPLSLYEALAADHRGAPGAHAAPRPHVPIDDAAVRRLGHALIPALDGRQAPSPLFLDHLGWALAAHVAQRYGGTFGEGPPAGRLAPWQERRAKALIAENLAGDLRLAELAEACRLSVGYFSRAFRRTVGLPPHRWLMLRRIDKAKALLLDPALPLAEIAQACGFTDQSHLTRAFNAAVGQTPARWRRERLN